MKNNLMTHMVCGFPNREESEDIFQILSNGSQYIEVQFPFSDPIADGLIIEKANRLALKNGMTTEECFNFLSSFSVKGSTLKKGKGDGSFNSPKILIMTYYNILFNYGVEKFIKKAQQVGVYGIIVPDVPFDEDDGNDVREVCKQYGIVFTEIVSPNTTTSRLLEISKLQPKLIYAISQNMTTGSQTEFGEDFEKYIHKIRKSFHLSPLKKGGGGNEMEGEGLKIGVGFGIKNTKHVKRVCNVADFAIIGSEFIKRYQLGGQEELKRYLSSLSE